MNGVGRWLGATLLVVFLLLAFGGGIAVGVALDTTPYQPAEVTCTFYPNAPAQCSQRSP